MRQARAFCRAWCWAQFIIALVSFWLAALLPTVASAAFIGRLELPVTNGIAEATTTPLFYSMDLGSGDTVSIRLVTSPASEFTFELLGPTVGQPPVSESLGSICASDFPRPLQCTVKMTGQYLLALHTGSSAGQYSIVCDIDRATMLSLEPPEYAIHYGDTGIVTARLMAPLLRGCPGQTLRLQRFERTAWVDCGEAVTDVYGLARFSIAPEVTTIYRAKFLGEESLKASISPGTVAIVKRESHVFVNASPAVVAYGGTTRMTLRTIDTDLGVAVPYQIVTLFRSYGNDVWVKVATVRTDDLGQASYPVRVYRKTLFMAVYDGRPDLFGDTSSMVEVIPRAGISAPTYTWPCWLEGTIRPGLSGAWTPAITIRAYRREGTRWILRRTLTANAHNITSRLGDYPAYTLYSARTDLDDGLWKLVASVGPTSLYLGSSASRQVTISGRTIP